MLAVPSPNFGYVLLTVGGTVIVHHVYMSFKVGAARKKFNVRYPALYADSSNKDCNTFNCIQRGMQNSLENLPSFLTMLTLTGLRYPIAASIAGLVYNIGRIRYFNGYSSGDPKARYKGGFLHFASLAQLGMLFMWAFELLMK